MGNDKNMNEMMKKMMAKGTVKEAAVLADSVFFNEKDVIPTDLPILNLAFSGSLDGGFVTGQTMFAGLSKSFKSLLGLFCMKAYLDKYPTAIGILYDSEFGITPAYLKTRGIDPNRVLHVPIENVETLKFDMVSRLDGIVRGDKVFFMIDSLGGLPSKKEVDDAAEEKAVADMTRNKQIRSFMRIVTPKILIRDLPCVMIAHVYQTMELYAKTVVGGGTALINFPNQVFIITRAQEKDGDELVGYTFTITIEKSRFVRERSKFEFTVRYDSDIDARSGLFDLALKTGHIVSPKKGWYQRAIQMKDGSYKPDKLWRRAESDCDEFWQPIYKETDFKQKVETSVKLGAYVDNQLPPKLLKADDEVVTGEDLING